MMLIASKLEVNGVSDIGGWCLDLQNIFSVFCMNYRNNTIF